MTIIRTVYFVVKTMKSANNEVTLTTYITYGTDGNFDKISTNSLKAKNDNLKKSLENKSCRSTHPEVFCEISVLKKSLRPATLLKKRLWHRCFPVNLRNF